MEPQPSRRPPRFVALALVLLLVGGTLSLVAGHRGSAFSQLDEPTHVDYAYQLVHGNVPQRGSILAPEIREEWSCRGPYSPLAPPLHACDAVDKSPRFYFARGENYNFGHPPLYYAVTGALAVSLDALVPGDHFIAAARATGALWLVAAMLLLTVGLLRLGCAWPYAIAASLLLPLTPWVLHASSAVTNDAAAPLAGAIAVYLLARVLVDRNLGWKLPATASALIAATKVLNALPLLFLAAALLLVLCHQHLREVKEEADPTTPALDVAGTLRVCAGLVLPFLVVFVGWQLFQSGRGPADWSNPVSGVNDRPISGLPFDELLSTSLAGFQPALGYYLPVQIRRPSLDAWASLLNALLVAGPLLAVLTSRIRSRTWFVGLVALLGIIGYPLVVQLQVLMQNGTYFPSLTTRYGLSLLPLLLGALALVASRRRLLRSTTAVTALGVVVVSLAVTGLG